MEDEIIKLVSSNLEIRAQFSIWEINTALTGGRGFVRTGTWVLSGSRITFEDKPDGNRFCTTSGTASSNRIKIERDCDFRATLVYEK